MPTANKSQPLPPWASMKVEPKRKYKFYLVMEGVPAWVIKTAGRPNVEISTGATHQFLAHTFKFPGRVQWNDIDITLVDPIDPDVAGSVLEIIENAGYVLPSDWTMENAGWKKSLSKKKFGSGPNALGDIAIQTLDSDGTKVEEWRLKNAWVKSINYDDLDYTSEDLMTITISLVYDYATLDVFPQEA